MSTIEDFENAPVGATATRADGSRAMKIYDGVQSWVTQNRVYLDNESIAKLGFTLSPLEPAPTTVREALDLAWELAHPIKERQVIPKGTRYLERRNHGLIKECTADRLTMLSDGLRNSVRTLEPLSDPEPDWLDAPAVIATTIGNDNHRTFMNVGNSRWRTIGEKSYHWNELTDVTPLRPSNGYANN